MTLLLLAIAAATAFVWLAILIDHRPMSIATVAFATAFTAQTSFGLSNPIVSRIPIALFLGLALLFAAGTNTGDNAAAPSLGLVRGAAAALITMLGISFAVTSSVSSTAEALGGAAAVFFVGITLGRYVPVSATIDRLFIAATALAAASVLSLGLGIEAWQAGRFRGVFENANGLGSAAMIASAAAPRRLAILSAPIFGAIIIASGSRASGLGFLVILLLRVEWRPSTRVGAVILAPLAVVAITLVAFSASTQSVDRVDEIAVTSTDDDSATNDPQILRTRDNRTAQWRQGLIDVRDNLPLGIGFGTAAFEYSNSPITLAVQTGVLSVLILAITARLGVFAAKHRDRRVRALISGMVAHSMFEGWMFAFGSFSAIVFWITLIAALTDHLRNADAEPLPVDAELSGLLGLAAK